MSQTPLNRPAFRTIWMAGLISDGGDWLLFVALPIVVLRLTGSALGTAAAFLAQLGAAMVLSPVGGRLGDRLDRRRLMIAVAVSQAVALLPLFAVHGRHGLVLVYGVIAVQAALAAIFDPARNALLPTLVGNDQLVAANSLVGLGEGIARLAGGPLGGLLLAAGSLHTIIAADAVTYLVAALLIARTVTPAADPTRRPVNGGRFATVLRRPAVRAGLAVALVADIAQGIFVVLFVVFVARSLHGGAMEIGLLRGIQAVGAIAAGLALAAGARRIRPEILVTAGALVFGTLSLLAWNLPGLTTRPAVYVVLFALVGAPGVVMVTGLVTALQHAAPDHERGRTFAALGLAENAGQVIGIAVAGLLTQGLGLVTVLNGEGCLYLAAGALAARILTGRLPSAPPGRTDSWPPEPSRAPRRERAWLEARR